MAETLSIDSDGRIFPDPMPCPFCGEGDFRSLHQSWNEDGDPLVVCRSCFAGGPPHCDHIQAVMLWNRRIPQTP